jgi:membrane dipeptidase
MFKIDFIKIFVVIGAISFSNFSLLKAQTQSELDPRVVRIVSETIGIDTHNHIDVPLDSAQLPGPKVDLAGELNKSGLSAVCMTFAVDYQRLSHEGQAYDRFLNGLIAMDAMLKDNNMLRALNAQDIINAHNAHQPIVIQSVEGGHFLEGKIERLQVAYDRGLRHLGLLHDNDASVPLGDIYTNEPKWGGLTKFGTEVIKECERLGILVDLAHCDNKTIDMALKVATKPIIITHTGLDTQLGSNEFMAKMMKPRLISKEEARKVAKAGGVIGVWAHLSDTPLEYAKNIRAMVDVVGVDHVCIGTDTKLTTPYRPPFNPNDQWNKPPKDGSSDGKGHNDHKDGLRPDFAKGPQGERIGERTNLVWKGQKVGFYYAVVDALLKTGFNEEEIAKICGGNFLRVFDAATKGH